MSLARAALLLAVALAGCHKPPDDHGSHGSAGARLREVTTPLAEPVVRRTVYVPVYSSIYLGDPTRPNVLLTATVSVRNVSSRHRVVLESARYYDSAGRHVRDYVERPSELPPLSTVEFVVRREDASGGPGANFLVVWAGPAGVDDPLFEAVMLGQSGNAGISFTSPGRVVANAP
jgi:hypothetical protein